MLHPVPRKVSNRLIVKKHVKTGCVGPELLAVAEPLFGHEVSGRYFTLGVELVASLGPLNRTCQHKASYFIIK